MERKVLEVPELSLQQLNPSTKNFNDPGVGGSKIVVIGKPGTGKSTLMKALLKAKSFIPVSVIVSGSENANKFYENFVPSSFIYNEYKPSIVQSVFQRQELCLSMNVGNPWISLILDDCMSDPSIFKSEVQRRLFKNGRHYKIFYVVAMQYALDIPPDLRSAVDGVFLFRETNEATLKKLWQNYASVIPSFELFANLMRQITGDYTAMFVNNSLQTNEWKKCIFFIKADAVDEDFKLGYEEVWKFHEARFNKEYEKNIFFQ